MSLQRAFSAWFYVEWAYLGLLQKGLFRLVLCRMGPPGQGPDMAQMSPIWAFPPQLYRESWVGAQKTTFSGPILGPYSEPSGGPK